MTLYYTIQVRFLPTRLRIFPLAKNFSSTTLVGCPFLSYLWTYDEFSSVAQSCPTLCDPMNRSTPGLPVRHHLPEFTQTHVHRVGDAIQHLILRRPLFLLYWPTLGLETMQWVRALFSCSFIQRSRIGLQLNKLASYDLL